jgi:hypothetical protein
MMRVTSLALFLAACSTPQAAAPDPSRVPADTTSRVPRGDPRSYSIETVLFEMPLRIAEDLYRRAEERDSTLGAPIDEAHCREALEILARSNLAIVRAERPPLTVDAGAVAPLPARVGTLAHPEHTLASDFLELSVGASPVHDWADTEIEARLFWTDVHGHELGRLPRAVSPMPDGYWLEIVCLPSRQASASIGALAVFAFLRVTPVEATRAPQ